MSAEDNKVCEVPDCPGFGTAHEPIVEQTVEATARLDMRGTVKMYDLHWWSGRLPRDAEVTVTGDGEMLVARWRM
jgi:hypothetical protein